MKKVLIVLSMLFTVGITSAFASEKDKVDPKVLSTFEKEFFGVQNVSWNTGRDFVKASFFLNGTRIEAYFSTDGELYGTARNILFEHLPLSVVKSINKRYGSAPVYAITECNSENGTYYLMTVELPTKKLSINATASGYITVDKKTAIK